MNVLLRILLVPGRIRHRWKNRKRRVVTDGLIATLKKQCEDARRHGFKNHASAYNAALFVVLVEQDLATYSSNLYYANSKWGQQFAARGMAVLLYESAEDLPVVLGKAYRACLWDLGLDQSWLDALNTSTSGFNAFKADNAEFLKTVRNYVGAHKEHDTLAQLAVLDTFDHMAVYRLGAKFTESLRLLVEFQMALLEYLKNPAVLLREAAKTVDQTNHASQRGAPEAPRR